jgi:hypothetical protein
MKIARILETAAQLWSIRGRAKSATKN